MATRFNLSPHSHQCRGGGRGKLSGRLRNGVYVALQPLRHRDERVQGDLQVALSRP